jgi:hypothetical protein
MAIGLAVDTGCGPKLSRRLIGSAGVLVAALVVVASFFIAARIISLTCSPKTDPS